MNWLTSIVDYLTWLWYQPFPSSAVALDDEIIPQNIWDCYNESIIYPSVNPKHYATVDKLVTNQFNHLTNTYELSDDEHDVLAQLFCNTITKLVVWDIGMIEVSDFPTATVVSSPIVDTLDNTVLMLADVLPHKMHDVLDWSTITSISEDHLQLLSTELASQINDSYIDSVFEKTGRPRTFKMPSTNCHATLLQELDAEDDRFVKRNNGYGPNWVIISPDLLQTYLDALSTDTVTKYDRGNYVTYNIWIHRLKLIVCNNSTNTKYMKLGFSHTDNLTTRPVIMVTDRLLDVDGPLYNMDGLTPRYSLIARFGLIPSPNRKQMVKTITITTEEP